MSRPAAMSCLAGWGCLFWQRNKWGGKSGEGVKMGRETVWEGRKGGVVAHGSTPIQEGMGQGKVPSPSGSMLGPLPPVLVLSGRVLLPQGPPPGST